MNKILHCKINHTIYFRIVVILLLLLSVYSQVIANSKTEDSSLFLEQVNSSKVTLKFKDSSIKDILFEIQKQTKINFVYQNTDLQAFPRKSVSVTNANLETVLKMLFSESNLSYVIKGNNITIVKKATSAVSKTASPQPNTNEKVLVKGTVVDQNNKPIAGATLIISGTNDGAISAANGGFSLTAAINSMLDVSCVGMVEARYAISKSDLNVVIKMTPNAMEVDDVVITGIFDRKKSGFAGATTVITKDDLQKVSTGNIFTTIATIDAGFKINENNLNGSNPNKLPDFTIRGKGSFQNGSTAPIFILDGFEVSSQKIFDMDMNRIESITLLKDASATILYGSRAANGVIVIETITPKAGQLRVTYDFKPTVGIVDLNGYDLMNGREKLEYERLAGLYDPVGTFNDKDVLERKYYERYKFLLQGTDTYWLSQPIQTSFSHAHSLFVEGGVDNVRYGIDASYNGNNGVMKGSGRDRIGLGFSLIYRIKDKVTVRNYISYGHTGSYDSPYGSYSKYGMVNPYEPIYDMNGKMRLMLSNGEPNPLYDAQLPNRILSNLQDFTERLSVDWLITKGLRLRGQVGLTKGNSNNENYTSPFSSGYVLEDEFVDLKTRGQLSLRTGNTMSVSSNFTLNYNTTLKEKHIFYAGIGSELTTQSSDSNGYTVTGFPDDQYSDPSFAIQYKEGTRASSSESRARSIGFFANGNYIYDNRFFIDLSARYDGSSRFGAANKFAPFWAVGGGWNIHNEKSWFKSKTIDMLKVRLSYGVTGNQEFSAYQARTMLNFNTDRLYNNHISATIMGYGNPELRWQNQYQTNLGVDFGINSRVRLSANYYNKLTDGMLTTVTVAPSLGLPSDTFTANLGKIQNVGYEANLNVVILRQPARDFEWSVMVQAAHNKNTLKEITNQLKSINNINNSNKKNPSPVYEEGQSMSALKAVRSLGIDPTTGQEVFLNKNGDITYVWDANDKVLCGDTEPILFGNFGTNLFYKGWNLNMSFQYRFGADYYNSTLAQRVEGADPHYNADRRVLNDRWKTQGEHARYKNIKEYTSTYISTRFVQKENMVQFGSLSLSYDFNHEMLKKWKINTFRLSFYANDVFRASTIKNERGLDYPFQQSYVFGLNIGF